MVLVGVNPSSLGGVHMDLPPQGPKSSAQEGVENLSYYPVGRAFMRKTFCKHCGVHIMNEQVPVPDAQIAGLPVEVLQWRAKVADLDIDFGAVETQEGDGYATIKPGYANP